MSTLLSAKRGRSSASSNGQFWSALRLVISVLLVWWLIRRGDLAWEPLKVSLAAWQFSVPAVLLLALTPLLQFWRWQILLRASGVRLPHRDVFSYMMVSKFFNMALPSYVGGDVIRGVYIARRARSADEGAAQSLAASVVVPSLLFDRLAGLLPLFAFIFIGSFGTLAASLPSSFLIFARCLSAGSLVAAAISFALARTLPAPPGWLMRLASVFRVREFCSRLYAGVYLYVRNSQVIAKILLISALSQGLILASFLLFGMGLGVEIPFSSYFVLAPLGLMTVAVPIAPGGLGVGQVAFLALFRMAGTTQGANLFTLYMLTQALINLSGAGLFPFVRARPAKAGTPH